MIWRVREAASVDGSVNRALPQWRLPLAFSLTFKTILQRSHSELFSKQLPSEMVLIFHFSGRKKKIRFHETSAFIYIRDKVLRTKLPEEGNCFLCIPTLDDTDSEGKKNLPRRSSSCSYVTAKSHLCTHHRAPAHTHIQRESERVSDR